MSVVRMVECAASRSWLVSRRHGGGSAYMASAPAAVPTELGRIRANDELPLVRQPDAERKLADTVDGHPVQCEVDDR